MNPELLTRYSRQIQLTQVGEKGQSQLLRSKALIVGMGGLGSPVSLYLAAAGIGELVLTDYDQVDASNLQRQIAHSNESIGQLKASSARETLLRLNPETKVSALDYELNGDELIAQAKKADIVVDCSDNYPTRFELNRISILTGTPLVSGAAIRWEGQVSTFDPRKTHSPCYQCLYPTVGLEAETCAMEGVIAPLVGVIGSIQAMEVVNCLLETGNGLLGKVLVFDAIAMEWQSIELRRNPDCPACSSN